MANVKAAPVDVPDSPDSPDVVDVPQDQVVLALRYVAAWASVSVLLPARDGGYPDGVTMSSGRIATVDGAGYVVLARGELVPADVDPGHAQTLLSLGAVQALTVAVS